MRLVLALPWYAGPDEHLFPLNFDYMMYLGAMRERSLTFKALGEEEFKKLSLPPLNEGRQDSGVSEPTIEEWHKMAPLEIAIANYSRTSLVGRARECVVESALQWDADWIFWWDSDIRFEFSAFLTLWRHQKSVVAGLAFTARQPIIPVIYRIVPGVNRVESEPVLDYPRGELISNEDVDGEIAFGAGVMLTHADVFRDISKPWFASTSCGEDWFFCWRCYESGIPRYVDTTIKTQHKLHKPSWADQDAYDIELFTMEDDYRRIYGDVMYEKAKKGAGK